MKPINTATIEFLSRSANEGFARTAAACFAAQLDPTLEEVNDIKTAVSEAVTNAVVHAYPDRLGKVKLRLRLFEDHTLEVTVQDWGVGIADMPAGPDPPLHHRGRGAGRNGVYHYGELYGQFEGALQARQGHRGHHAPPHLPPGGGRVSATETASLLEAARGGDNDACERLMEENAGLIWSVVRRYYGRGSTRRTSISWAAWGFSRRCGASTPPSAASSPPTPCPRSPGRSGGSSGTTGR